MPRLVHTGTFTEHHKWALPYLKGYDVEFVFGDKDYKQKIADADICVSIIADHLTARYIIPIKLYDYIEQRKKILHFMPCPGISSEMLYFNEVILRGDPQSKVDEFIRNGKTDYGLYRGEYSIEWQYKKLTTLLL